MGLVNRWRAQALLTRFGLDALVATTPPNLRYLLDWIPPSSERSPRLGSQWAILPADPARPIGAVLPLADFLAFPFARQPAAAVRAFLSAVPGGADTSAAEVTNTLPATLRERVCPDLATALDEILITLGLAGGRLAFDDPAAVLALESEGVLLSRPTGADLFRRLRAVKTADEIERIRAATEANATALRAAVAVAEPQRPWGAVGDTWRREVVAAGAAIIQWNASLADSSAPPDRPLARHEAMGLLGAAAIDGYWSELGRVAVVGDRLPKAERAAHALAKAMEMLVPRLEAGATVEGLTEAAEEASGAAGLPPPLYEPVRGIGIERAELPAAGVEGENVLEPGNVVVVSFTYREPGWAMLTLAEPVLITATTPRRLSSLTFDLLVTRE
ncbi:MAG: M24 family metallopeptidase [Chloroflexota bacterium]|nr:M24 family metallopeptidase [Dehalococcoidia bacterium]MDW8253315.1 M24 family metallopeptidase [Chloroflexota bacterium]